MPSRRSAAKTRSCAWRIPGLQKPTAQRRAFAPRLGTPEFHLYTAYAIVPAQMLRAVHLAFVLSLCFLVFPVARRYRHRIMWWDWAMAALAIAIVVYLLYGGDDLTDRNTSPLPWDIAFGIALVVLGGRAAGLFSAIAPPTLLAFSTASSEAAYPQTLEALEAHGVSNRVASFVLPLGYSFNLDGTNIYMTLATLFLAQATNIDLTLTQELTLLAVAMLTSKGASGVTGAGFITLAATLAVVPTIPVAALAVLVGVDRFMSECRALTNLVGNGVATLVVARWDGDLDRDRLKAELDAGPQAPA